MLKLVPVIVETSRDHGVGLDRRNLFPYHVPSPANCSLAHHNGQPSHYSSSPLTQCFWTFFWLAVLLFVAFPVGILSGQLYILLSPLSVCCRQMALVLNLLLEGLHLPLVCTNNMAVAKPLVGI